MSDPMNTPAGGVTLPELKACPFCGGSPAGFAARKTNTPLLEQLSEESGGGWRVICYACHIKTFHLPSAADAATAWNARAALAGEWRDIASAPRDGTCVIVACHSDFSGWHITEAWWAIPYEGAPPERGWWCYGGNRTMLDASIHVDKADKGLGASHWMPLPAAPLPKEPGR